MTHPMDFELARANMIEQQIRPWNVLEMKTLGALNDIRREDFVPQEFAHLAFVDTQIPLKKAQVMLEPKVCGRMVEALDLQPHHKVLEIGTGSGYLTALMALLSDHVTTLEIDSDLSEQAKRTLSMNGITNVTAECIDCFDYCENISYEGTFDRIMVTGSTPELQNRFLKLLNSDGLMASFVGFDPAMQAVISKPNGLMEALFETSIPRLKNIVEPKSFDF